MGVAGVLGEEVCAVVLALDWLAAAGGAMVERGDLTSIHVGFT